MRKFFLAMQQFFREPVAAFKPELGSNESGKCRTSAESISIPAECANF